MALPRCPFQVECQFYNEPAKTEADETLVLAFCSGRYDACEILDRYVEGQTVPPGARPNGEVLG